MGEMAELLEWYGEEDAPYFPELDYGFWRDKKGGLHRVSTMETSHLKNIANMLDRNFQEVPEILALELEFREQQLGETQRPKEG